MLVVRIIVTSNCLSILSDLQKSQKCMSYKNAFQGLDKGQRKYLF